MIEALWLSMAFMLGWAVGEYHNQKQQGVHVDALNEYRRMTMVHAEEQEAWRAERKNLLNRLQAKTFVDYRAMELEEPEEARERVAKELKSPFRNGGQGTD